MQILIRTACALAVVLTGGPAVAQAARRDTTTRLDTVTVTAERVTTSLLSTPAAVTRLSREEVARIPQATLADVLRTVPGFAVVDFEGLGFEPQVMARGFYGGGEAEYVVVLIDGKPLNLVHTGRVAWDAVPSGTAIQAIEVVRGGASSLYGDAAIGGVINIITTGERGSAASGGIRIAAGSHGLSHISTGASGGGRSRNTALSFSRDDTEGFRVRGQRSATHFRIRAAPIEGEQGHFAVAYFTQSRNADDAGPVTDEILAVDRTFTDILFGFDRSTDRAHEIALDGARRLTGRTSLSWFATTAWRTMTNVRTLALAPGFGDTKQRDAKLRRTMLSLQVDVGEAVLPLDGRLVIGAEYALGSADSRYYAVAGGDREAYAGFTGGRGAIDAGVDAARTTVSAFAQYAMHPLPRVRVTLGGRLDRIDDESDAVDPSAPAHREGQHEVFSPKAGLNVRLFERPSGSSSVWIAAGRSFKAPTLDQLYDQRSYPVPFEPFSLTSSNAALLPQEGESVEIGINQTAVLGPSVVATLSISAYRMDMENEIDFDVATLSYGNIASSRHQGAEVGIRVAGPRSLSGFLTWTLQDAAAMSGDNRGRQLKAIPRHSASGGVTLSPYRRVEAGVVITRTGSAFIDDANTRKLDPWTRVDARVGVQLGGYQVFGEARNLLGTTYNSTGFLDPSGSGAAYYYPAAGRVLMIGVGTGGSR